MSKLQLDYARQIKRLHQEIVGNFRSSLKAAIQIGKLLTEQKGKLEHGEFLPWVEKTLPFTDRTARRYMQLYECRGQLKSDTVSDLREAYRLLTSPKLADVEPVGGDAKSETVSVLPKADPAPEPSGPVAFEEDAKPKKPAKAKADPVEAPESAIDPVDGDEKAIPEHLRTVFESREQFERFAQTLSTLKGQVTQAIDADPVSWSQFNGNAFDAAIAKARDLLTLSGPHIVCAYCGGSDSQNCRACKGSGFLSKAKARCAAQELRQKNGGK